MKNVLLALTLWSSLLLAKAPPSELKEETDLIKRLGVCGHDCFPSDSMNPVVQMPQRFHCTTRITYMHYVYSNGCSNNEVLVRVISQQWPNKVVCGKIEADCWTK